MVANPTPGLRAALRSARITPVRTFNERVSPIKAWLKAIRLHQWAKNVLIFVALLLSHAWAPGLVAAVVLAFFSFGLCASATYIVNDLLDLEVDRQHPRKRLRPFASGDLSALSGVVVVVLFLAASLVLALLVPHVIAALSPSLFHSVRPYYFLVWLGIYLVTTLAYSLRLKRSVLVDVIVLSGLYTIRIIAGSAATGIAVSTWLGSFSIFFFLSLAFVKRFAELENLRDRGGVSAGGRGYHIADIEQLRSFGSASGYASVVVLTLYISNLDAAQLYPTPSVSGFSFPSFSSGSAASGSRPPAASSTKTPSSTPSPTAAASSSASSSSPSSSPPSNERAAPLFKPQKRVPQHWVPHPQNRVPHPLQSHRKGWVIERSETALLPSPIPSTKPGAPSFAVSSAKGGLSSEARPLSSPCPVKATKPGAPSFAVSSQRVGYRAKRDRSPPKARLDFLGRGIPHAGSNLNSSGHPLIYPEHS